MCTCVLAFARHSQLNASRILNSMFNARKRSLGQDNVFTRVYHSVHRGGLCMMSFPVPCSFHHVGLCRGGDLCPGCLCPDGVSVQGSLSWESLSRNGWGSLSRGESLSTAPIWWKTRRYASYWNAFCLNQIITNYNFIREAGKLRPSPQQISSDNGQGPEQKNQ